MFEERAVAQAKVREAIWKAAWEARKLARKAARRVAREVAYVPAFTEGDETKRGIYKTSPIIASYG